MITALLRHSDPSYADIQRTMMQLKKHTNLASFYQAGKNIMNIN